MRKQKLIIDQLDNKIKKLAVLKNMIMPSEGWIFSIRTALKMSRQQLGNKMKMTRQGVKDIESREKAGAITLNTLKKVGAALDMKLVYGFIPNSGTIGNMIEERAKHIAEEIILRTSTSMRLEDQENLPERIQENIKFKKQELIEKMPKFLWD